jgi:GxxExxY protein
MDIDIEAAARQIVDSAVKVHRALGPGLFESAYQKCLAHELRKRGMCVDCEIVLPIHYDGITIESGYRLDMLIEKSIVIENKAVDEVAPIHGVQLLTYLKLGDFPMGFLINWNTKLIKDGINRIVNPKYKPTGAMKHSTFSSKNLRGL